MLKQNGSILNQLPISFRNGYLGMHRTAWSQDGRRRNLHVGDNGINDKSGVPSGHLAPSSWILPLKPGGLSAFTGCNITFNPSAPTLAGGKNISGTAAITFTVPDALMGLIANLSGTAAITFTVPNATLGGAANLAGTSSITFSVPNALLGGAANLTATSSITFASDATLTAIGYMSGPAPDEGLTTTNIAAAVWAQIIEAGFSAQDVMQLLAAVAAGKTEIVDLGGGAATVTFRDLGDTKDSVVADMTGSERTTITLDI